MKVREFVDLTNPYLKGNFAPVGEELTVEKLTVIGQLPRELNGLYVRNGPNPQLPPKGAYHWFDGDGMLHGVHFEDGQASYRNRFVMTQGFLHEQKQGRSIWKGMTGFPDFRQILFPPEGLRAKNTANTALVWHAGRLLALWEVGEPYEVSVPGLETIGRLDLGPSVKAFTAHPKVDPFTGEMLFFGMNYGPKPYIHYGIIDEDGQMMHAVDIPLAESVFMHDFAITQQYTIFMDLPFVLSLKDMMLKGVAFTYHERRPARFGIMPRYGRPEQITWFETDPCYVFHTMNAYEEIGHDGMVEEIVLLASRMNRGTIAPPPGHSMHNPGHSAAIEAQQISDDAGRLFEWRFNLKTGKVKGTQLDDRLSDFPRVNDFFLGRQNRFGYMAHVRINPERATPEFTEIIKRDLRTSSESVHRYGPSRFGGEAVFVPRSDEFHLAEDDGWLLTYLFDEATERSELIVVDARSMDQEPVARVLLPQRVPYGFHGTWIPSVEMALPDKMALLDEVDSAGGSF